MTLYLVGLGLGDEKDITVKGLEAVRASDKVFLEMYTAILGVDKGRLVRRFLTHTHHRRRCSLRTHCNAVRCRAAPPHRAVAVAKQRHMHMPVPGMSYRSASKTLESSPLPQPVSLLTCLSTTCPHRVLTLLLLRPSPSHTTAVLTHSYRRRSTKRRSPSPTAS